MYEGQSTIVLPDGTVDVLNCNLRSLNRLTGTATSSSGTADNAFDGDLTTTCTLGAAAGNISLFFSGTAVPTNFGILPNVSGTWDIAIQTSIDGVSWSTVYSNSALSVSAGLWNWIDVEGVLSSTIAVRLLAGATTTLDVREFYVANTPNEIPLAKVNRDSYSNMPNKSFRSRPTEFWYDKRRGPTAMNLWPVPSTDFVFWQLVNYIQRQVQDVGSLTQSLDIPQRWFLAIINELAKELALSIPEVKPELRGELLGLAAQTMSEAWAGENDGSPTYILPNIRPYTA